MMILLEIAMEITSKWNLLKPIKDYSMKLIIVNLHLIINIESNFNKNLKKTNTQCESISEDLGDK